MKGRGSGGTEEGGWGGETAGDPHAPVIPKERWTLIRS